MTPRFLQEKKKQIIIVLGGIKEQCVVFLGKRERGRPMRRWAQDITETLNTILTELILTKQQNGFRSKEQIYAKGKLHKEELYASVFYMLLCIADILSSSCKSIASSHSFFGRRLVLPVQNCGFFLLFCDVIFKYTDK